MSSAEFTGSSSSGKVAEIFLTASAAFQKLGELTLQLNMSSSAQHSAHWSEKEVELLRGALFRFSNDLDNIADVVRQKTSTQIRIDYKRKALEDESGSDGKLSVGPPPPIKRRSYATPASKRQAIATDRRQTVAASRQAQNVHVDEGYPDYASSMLSPSP